MSTIRLRTPCTLVRQTATYDLNGRPIHSAIRRRMACAVIFLIDQESDTTVRADSSASRGRAEEIQYEAKLLLAPRTEVRTGDLLKIDLGGGEITVEIFRVHRRLDVGGKVDHIEVEGNRWASA